MNSLAHFKQTTVPLFFTFMLGCFALLPSVQAVAPAPDGCYPNFTTAEGCGALSFLTSGSGNTALGWRSLFSDSTGSFNTAVGGGALVLNNGDSNTAVGAAALLLNTTGGDSTAIGADALLANVASGNTAIGSRALFNNTTGGTPGTPFSLPVGPNVAIGTQALQSNTIASAHTAVGYRALASVTVGFHASDLGASTAVGFEALASATGDGATANNAFGYRALANDTSGYDNVAVGGEALENNISGSNNIGIGNGAGLNVTSANNVICIGPGINAANVSNTTWIDGIYGATTVSGVTQPVVVSDDGQLGTISSSRRFKKEICAMDNVSESILALKPVTFHYKSDAKCIAQFGLIAEDVAEVNPDLVSRDKNGKIYSVRYDAVNMMLLNEFLKEHKAFVEEQRKVQELTKDFQVTIAQQQRQIEMLRASLQKVSTQLATAGPSLADLK